MGRGGIAVCRDTRVDGAAPLKRISTNEIVHTSADSIAGNGCRMSKGTGADFNAKPRNRRGNEGWIDAKKQPSGRDRDSSRA